MKTLYTTIAISLFIFSLNTKSSAQVSVVPDPVVVDEVDFEEFETIGYATLTNESGQPLNITWTREEVMLPEGWTSAVCDFNICHLDWVSTQNFNAPIDGEGDLDVHIYPNGSEGAAVIAVHLESANLPDFEMTVMYYFNTALGTSERLYQNFEVYPNPTVDEVRIDSEAGVHSVDVFNIDGKLVKQAVLAGSNTVRMADLPMGNYILRFKDTSGTLLSTNVVVRL